MATRRWRDPLDEPEQGRGMYYPDDDGGGGGGGLRLVPKIPGPPPLEESVRTTMWIGGALWLLVFAIAVSALALGIWVRNVHL